MRITRAAAAALALLLLPTGAQAQSSWARAKQRMAQHLAKGGLYAAPDAIRVMRNRNEKEAARAVLGLLAAHQLDGRRPPKGFGLATPALVRLNAIETLATMTSDACVDELLGKRGAASRSWEVRSACLEALGPVAARLAERAGADSERYGKVMAALRAGAQDEDVIVRTCAVTGLGGAGSDEAADLLAAALPDAAWQVRYEAIRGLRRLKAERAVPALIDALGRERGRFLAQVIEALKHITGGEVGTDPELWKAWWAANKDKARDQRAGAGGHRTRAHSRFYGVAVDGDKIAFVIDVTGSMHRFHETEAARAWLEREKELKRPPYEGDTLILLAQYQLQNVVREMPAHALFNITIYSTSGTRSFERSLVPASKRHKGKAASFIRSLSIGGDTNTYDGMLEVLENPKKQRKGWSEGPDTIYLFTDGDTNSGAIWEPGEVADAMEAICRFRRIRIHTIGLSVTRKNMLERMAEKTGGTFVDVDIPIDAEREAQHGH
ncbi:MAG: HEAT repeat domain-containing protein [Planctomycetota bacterium]|jgi:HEAT repeat protein